MDSVLVSMVQILFSLADIPFDTNDSQHPLVQGYGTSGYRLCETLGTDQWTTWCAVFEPFFRIKIVQALFWLMLVTSWIGISATFFSLIVVQKKDAFLKASG